MSNASDKPEDEGAGTPAGDAPSAPTPEPETGPERATTGSEPEPTSAEQAEQGGEAASRPAQGAAPSTEDAPAAGGARDESATGAAGGTDHTVELAEPGSAAGEPQHEEPEPPAGVPADPGQQGYQQQGYQQQGYGQTAYMPPGYGQPSGYWQPGYWQPGYGPSGYGQPAHAPSWYGPPGHGQPPGVGQQPFGGGPSGPAPRPGIVPLRPLATGDVLAGAVRYIGENPLTTLATAAVAAIITVGVQLIVDHGLPPVDPAALARGRVDGLVGSTLGLVGSALVSVVVGAVLTGLLLVVLSQAVLGRRIGAGEAWRLVAPRAAGLVGLTLLIGLVIVVVMLVPLLLAFVAGATGSGEAIVVGVVLVMAAAVATCYLTVLWALAPAVYVLEPVGVAAAMRRSARLVHRSWWRTFGVLLLSGLLIAIPAIVVMGLLGALVETPVGVGEIVRVAIAYVVVGTFATPFGVGVTGLLYVDQRIRRERLDLELARYPAAPR